MTVGWASVRVDGFRIKPTQCYKCWHFGHVRNTCKANIDRTGLYFRCGRSGHSLRDCDAISASCAICEDNRLDHNHRLGSVYCPSVKLRGPGRLNNNIQG